MIWQWWFIVVIQAIGLLSQISLLGKPREPIESAHITVGFVMFLVVLAVAWSAR